MATGRVLALGFAAFNAADSANVPTQSGAGAESGTMTIGGQVDQGSSSNKGMRLTMALADYSDGDIEETAIIYDTGDTAPVDVDLSLRDIPDGTVTGTVVGSISMTGDLVGLIALEYALSGLIEPGVGDEVALVDGSTGVTGSATSEYGTFEVDFSF